MSKIYYIVNKTPSETSTKLEAVQASIKPTKKENKSSSIAQAFKLLGKYKNEIPTKQTPLSYMQFIKNSYITDIAIAALT